MGREVRRVPADWKHPKQPGTGYVPLLNGSYAERAAAWDEGAAKWKRGMRLNFGPGPSWVKKTEAETGSYEEWDGQRPESADYMPDWPEAERTHLQMYEDTTEGTPISPVMETPEALARWLADNGASAFGDQTATYEQWLATILAGSAPSAVVTASGEFQSGVAAMLKAPKP